MPFLERDRDECERRGVRAEGCSRKDEPLPNRQVMLRQLGAHGGKPGEQAGLGARARLHRSEQTGGDDGDGNRGSRQRGVGRDRIVEDHVRPVVGERVRGRKRGVAERHQLQPRVAEAPGEQREERGLSGPRHGKTCPGEHVRGRDGRKGQRGHTENEGEGRLTDAKHRQVAAKTTAAVASATPICLSSSKGRGRSGG